MKNWSKEMKDLFNEEYKKVRVRWYWKIIEIAEQYHDYFGKELD